MDSLVEDAFRGLYPGRDPDKYEFSLKYSGKFRPYNANIRMRRNRIEASLSEKWKTVSKEIQIGLIQEILRKLIKTTNYTYHQDLYNHFMKRIHIAAPKTHNDPVLQGSFDRNNERFFNGMLERPNLRWGSRSMAKLGCYEYGSDTITMSTIFQGEDPVLLDYVMYHEMLHKKLKYDHNSNGRSRYHTSEFRRREALFPNHARLEQELTNMIRRQRRKGKGFLSFY